MSLKTAILGGGITGVSLAYFLQNQGVDWQLFEAAPRLGGLCRSETTDGFVADCAGGHIIFSKDQEVLDFVLGILGEGNHHQTPRKSAIYYRGDYVQYPFENGLADLPLNDNYECLSGYVKSDFERRTGAAEPTNFKDWCMWRFGSGISKHFMFPYNEKLWNIDLKDMNTSWVSGRIPDAPVDDVLRASIGIRTEGYKHQSVFWYPLEGGFETIVKSVAAKLDESRLHVSAPVKEVVIKKKGFDVDGVHYDKLFSTLPLPELKKVMKGIPDDIAASFDRLQYTSLWSVIVAIDAPDKTDRSWIYFPHPETGPFNRLTHLSNYSPGNAPKGKSSVMVEVTHRGELDLDDAKLAEIVDHLADCDILERDKVLFSRAWNNKYAYILYTHDLEENLDRVRSWLKGQGVEILGRFGNYDYFNSDQCIRAAMDAAKSFKG
ncbi:MAG: FAD-dependent oxidoreductase [Planctomycetota bacterium]